MSNKINQCGIVVLAAGQSRRLGSPKQLLSFEGDVLISRAIEVATHSGIHPVVVVLGAHATMIEPYVKKSSIQIVINKAWEEGVSSSIKKGLETMIDFFPAVDGVLFMVCDQPFLQPSLIEKLIEVQNTSGKPAAAATYDGIIGTPALFHSSLFNILMQLEGDKGARKLLDQLGDDVSLVTFKDGITDIDTKKDYENLLANT